MKKNRGALYALHKTLRKLAAKWIQDIPATKAERNAEVMTLPSRDGLKRDEARELCEKYAMQGRAARIQRLQNKISSRLGRSVCCSRGQYTNVKTGKQSNINGRAILRSGIIEERLANRIISIVLDIFREIYRYPDEDHGDEVVEIAESATLKQEQSLDWNLYRGNWKGHPATITDTTIYVRRNYLTNVYLKNITIVDNVLIIDANLFQITGNSKVYAVKWLKQSRGYSLVVVDGYVAVNGRGTKRGDTPEQALRKLNRLTGTARKS